MSKDPILSGLASPFQHRKFRGKISLSKKRTPKRKGSKKVMLYAAYPCAKCGKQIQQKQLIVANGKYWHKKCWTKEKNRSIKITSPKGVKKSVKIGW